MIGVDTSVVISLFVRDDYRQHEAAKALFRARRKDGPIFICIGVLLEAIWTFKTLYGYDDAAMKRMLLGLCSLPNTVVEHMDTVFSYATEDEGDADLADALIAAANKNNGCRKTLTFDAQAAETVGSMEWVS